MDIAEHCLVSFIYFECGIYVDMRWIGCALWKIYEVIVRETNTHDSIGGGRAIDSQNI